MATSQSSGKNSSGDYIYATDEYGNPLEDEDANRLIAHDLGEIADAFVQFAREQCFDFWRD